MAQLKGFKFVTTLVLVFKMTESEDKFLFNLESRSNYQRKWHERWVSINITVITSMQKSLGKVLDWTIDWVVDHAISISK